MLRWLLRTQKAPSDENVATRSEFKIYMIAGGNHTKMYQLSAKLTGGEKGRGILRS